jgi:hypothetical protein
MLVHLSWNGAAPTFAQVLSSFATPRTRQPVLEIHGAGGTVAIPDIATWYDLDAPVDVLRLDPSREGGREEWQPMLPPERARSASRSRPGRSTWSTCWKARASRS